MKQRNIHDADVADTWYQFRVSASTPPDKRVHVRAGYLLVGWYWLMLGDGGWVDATAVDFSSGLDSLPLSFTTANSYVGVILCYTFETLIEDGIPPGQGQWATPVPWTIGGDIEYNTAIEAEARIQYMLSGNQEIQNGYYFPLCALVLRNDGTVGTSGAILPIDMINRDRSYIWMDCRPRHYLRA